MSGGGGGGWQQLTTTSDERARECQRESDERATRNEVNVNRFRFHYHALEIQAQATNIIIIIIILCHDRRRFARIIESQAKHLHCAIVVTGALAVWLRRNKQQF